VSLAAEAPIPSSSRTISGYYTLAGLYTLSAAAIWGVNTLFLLDAGLSFFEVFVANAAFSLGTVLFEIPTGVVADTLGRRMSFLLSVSVLGLSTLAYVGLAEIDAGVIAFSAASMVMALGFTFYSGAMEAWLVDALAATGYRGILDRVFARGSQVTSAAMLVGTIGGGFLGQIDLSIPYVLRSILLVAVFVVAFVVMHDVGFTPGPSRQASCRRRSRRVHGLGSRSAGGSGHSDCSCLHRPYSWAFSAGPSMRLSPTCWACSRAMQCGSSAWSRPR